MLGYTTDFKRSALDVELREELQFCCDIDGITILNKNCDLSLFADDLVVDVIVNHKAGSAEKRFPGILKCSYYGIHYLDTYEVIPFCTFGRYNVFLGWNRVESMSFSQFVDADIANSIIRPWVSATLELMDDVDKCRKFIPTESMSSHKSGLSLPNSTWKAFKKCFQTAFSHIQSSLPEEYNDEPELIVQSYGEKEKVEDDKKVSESAGKLSKIFNLKNVECLWITPAFSVSVVDACAFWRRSWFEDQLELGDVKDFQCFNQLGSHEIVNASWFEEVPAFLQNTCNDTNSMYDVTKIQSYSETIYSYNNNVGDEIDLHYNTPLTAACALQPLQDINKIDSKQLINTLTKYKEKLTNNSYWTTYKRICDNLKKLTCGARFEMTLYYNTDDNIFNWWEEIDNNVQDLYTEFGAYIKNMATNKYTTPVFFFPKQLITDYMLKMGSEIQVFIDFFQRQLKNANNFTIMQLKLIHILERLISWLWKGDHRRLSYRTCKEINFDEKLEKYNHPVILGDGNKAGRLISEGCKVVVEPKASYWKCVQSIIPRNCSFQFKELVDQMLKWQLEFAKTCSKSRSNSCSFFAKTLFNFWFTQLKLTIWRQTSLFKEICKSLKFTQTEKEQSKESFEQLFTFVNQKLHCNSCFEEGSFHLLCSRSKKLKINESIYIDDVISQVWSMSNDIVSKFVLEQALNTVVYKFSFKKSEKDEFIKSVNQILIENFENNKIGIFWTLESVGSINLFNWASISYTKPCDSDPMDLQINCDEIDEYLENFVSPKNNNIESKSKLVGKNKTISFEQKLKIVKANGVKASKLKSNSKPIDSSPQAMRDALIAQINENIKIHCSEDEKLMNNCLIHSFESLSKVRQIIFKTIYNLSSTTYNIRKKAVLYELVLYYLEEASNSIKAKTRKAIYPNITNTFVVEALGNKFFTVKYHEKRFKKTLDSEDTTREKTIRVDLQPRSEVEILEEWRKRHPELSRKSSHKPLDVASIMKGYEDEIAQ